MKLGLALAPLLLGGCDILFELRPVPVGDAAGSEKDSSGGDGKDKQDAAAGCAFVDNFNDNSLSASWQLIDSASQVIVTETGGQLQISPKVGVSGSNGVITATTHDMRDMVLTVIVSPASEAGGVQTGLYVGPDTNNYAAIETGGNNVNLRVMSQAGTQSANNNYDPADAWWRIRHSTSTGMTYFSFSADGSTFTPETAYAMGFSMAAVKISMAVTASAVNAPGQAHFDDFMLCPAP